MWIEEYKIQNRFNSTSLHFHNDSLWFQLIDSDSLVHYFLAWPINMRGSDWISKASPRRSPPDRAGPVSKFDPVKLFTNKDCITGSTWTCGGHWRALIVHRSHAPQHSKLDWLDCWHLANADAALGLCICMRRWRWRRGPPFHLTQPHWLKEKLVAFCSRNAFLCFHTLLLPLPRSAIS